MKLAGLFRSSWLVKQAAVGLFVGPLMAGYAVMNRVPQEAQLTHVVGVVETGKKAATKRRRGGEDVHYEFDVRSDTGKPFKLRVPSDDLSDQDMRAVLAAKVIEAKFDGASDLFALTADGRPVLTYASTRDRRQGINDFLAMTGGLVIGTSLLLGLIGWLWNRRSET